MEPTVLISKVKFSHFHSCQRLKRNQPITSLLWPAMLPDVPEIPFITYTRKMSLLYSSSCQCGSAYVFPLSLIIPALKEKVHGYKSNSRSAKVKNFVFSPYSFPTNVLQLDLDLLLQTSKYKCWSFSCF